MLGTYYISLVVSDGTDNSAANTVIVNVVENLPPVADAGADYDIFLTETAYLDGYLSYDPDGDPIVSYTWVIDSAPTGSTAALTGANSATPGLIPDMLGTYYISLVVSDGTDDSAADTVIVNVVENLPPVAIVSAYPVIDPSMGSNTVLGLAPLTVNFDASPSFDPEGGPLTFSWDLGDPGSGDNTSTLDMPGHTYANPGTYTAVVTVTDDFFNTDRASVEITVTAPNLPPSVAPTATPSSGAASLNVRFTANASDPEGDQLTYTWDFGDGTYVSSETNPIHTYDNMGTYEAVVTVSDGEYTVSAALIISVSSSLSIDVHEAKVDFGDKGEVEGKVNLKADFTYTDIPGSYDLIVVVFDGITLVEEPFLNFEEEDNKQGEYEYKEKNLHVKIDFNKGTIKVSRHKMLLTGIDNSNGIDVVISFGNSTGTDHFVMEEKGHKKDHDDNDDDHHDDDDHEKKLSYKDKEKHEDHDD